MKHRSNAPLIAVNVKLRRPALLRATALQATAAIVLISQGHAQLAPTARPAGGQVVAGSATIGQSTAQTTVVQSSQRAAIDWRSFDVGSNHTVQFNQPGASAVTLNRVTGPDPSQIAGQIIANGNIIITNPSGVMFHQGAQVNANGLIASAPGITNRNFMGGRMVFDQAPHPNASVTNAGTITVKQAGLAALVAPRVVNSGTINARLGRAVLAGAENFSVDLYGDGLVALDVTKAVRQVPVGPDGKPVTALVTNTGTVIANGGTVQLTAKAVDGIVQTLVEAGGTIQADTVGSQPGRVVIAGVGGSVRIAGSVLAEGGPGSAGGTIKIKASDAVTIAPAAKVSANGHAGGGMVALGTSLKRARAGAIAATTGANSPATPKNTSRQVVVEAEATVSADALGAGTGGTVATLSTRSTVIAGTVSAKGGPRGGNGGVIETSSAGDLSLTGEVRLSAPSGIGGTLSIDPFDLIISNSSSGPSPAFNTTATNPTVAPTDPPTTGTSYLQPSVLERASQNGAVRISLSASHDLTVQDNVNLAQGRGSVGSGSSGASLFLHADNNVTVNGNITMGTLDPNGQVPVLTLEAGNNVAILGAINHTGGGPVVLTAAGLITEQLSSTSSPTGTITAGSLSGTAAVVHLAGANQIANLDTFGVSGAGLAASGYGPSAFFLADSRSLTVTGNVSAAAGNVVLDTTASSAANVTLSAPITTPGGDFDVYSGHNVTVGPQASINATNGNSQIFLEASYGSSNTGSNGSITTNGNLTANSVYLGAGSGGINIFGDIAAGNYVALRGNSTPASTDLTFGSIFASGAITAPYLSARGTLVTLTGSNAIQHLSYPPGGSTVGTSFATPTSGGGSFQINDTVALSVDQPVTSGTIILQLPQLTIGSGGSLASPAASGTIFLSSATGQPLTLSGTASSGAISAGSVYIGGTTTPSSITIDGPINLAGTNTVFLQSAGAITETGAGALVGSGLQAFVTAGSATLAGANRIDTLGPSSTNGGLVLNDLASLAVIGPVSTTNGPIALSTAGGQSLTIQPTQSVPPTPFTLAAPGNRISLQSDTLVISGAISTGTTATGASGEVAIAPTTAGRTVDVAAIPLGRITTGTLAVGSIDNGATVQAGNVTINAPISLPGATLALYATDAVTGAGAITAGTLTGSADHLSLGGANQIDAIGAFPVAGANISPSAPIAFVLSDTVPLTLTGNVSAAAGNVLISTTLTRTADVTVAAPINSPGGDFSIRAGRSVTVLNTGSIRAGGQVFLEAAFGANSPTAPGGVTVNGALAGTNVFLDAGAGVAGAGGISLAADVTASNLLALRGQGNTSQPLIDVYRGPIDQTAGTLSATYLSARGTTVNLNGANSINNLGLPAGGTLAANAAVSGDYSLVSVVPLNVLTQVAVPTGRTITLLGQNPSITGAGSLSAPGGTVVLAPVAFGQSLNWATANPAGSITAATLQLGSAGAGTVTVGAPLNASGAGILLLTGAVIETGTGAIVGNTLVGNAASAALTGANQIATLGDFATTGRFALNDAQSLAVAGAVTAASGGMSLSTATGQSLTVQPGSALTATGQQISLQSDTLVADGRLSTGPAGIVAISPTSASGTYSVPNLRTVDAGTLAIGSLDGGRTVPANDIQIGGAVSLANGTVAIYARGDVTEIGSITADQVTGMANSLALGGNNSVVNLGSFTGSNLSFSNLVPLTVKGPLSAATIALVAPDIVLDNGRIATDGASVSVTSPGGRLLQQGRTTVTPLTGTQARLNLVLTGDGSVISLNDLQASNVGVVLTLRNGTASGKLDVDSLQLVAAGGSATLSGSIKGNGENSAAGAASIVPDVDIRYTLNGCVIASATCSGIMMQTPPGQPIAGPIARPLIVDTSVGETFLVPKSFLESALGNTLKTNLFTVDLITIGIARDQADPELLLPNVSDRDY